MKKKINESLILRNRVHISLSDVSLSDISLSDSCQPLPYILPSPYSLPMQELQNHWLISLKFD